MLTRSDPDPAENGLLSDADLAEIARGVLRTEAGALQAMAQALPDGFAPAARLIAGSRGHVVLSGMGKSGHVARKIAATLASTGTPAFFLHPAEASHGDLGMIGAGDVCLLLSNSGETKELHDLILHARRFANPIIAITRQPGSTLARHAEIALILPDAPEACAVGMAPTTSTTCALALGDALAVAVMRQRGFGRDTFEKFHPGGKLGAQFLRVGDIMHGQDELPIVTEDMPMAETLLEMSAKGFGIVALAQAGKLTGVITDGDLRRNLKGLMDRRAGDVATRTPLTAGPDMLATEALGLMNRRKIGALVVVDAAGGIVGLIHIHDCLRAGVA